VSPESPDERDQQAVVARDPERLARELRRPRPFALPAGDERRELERERVVGRLPGLGRVLDGEGERFLRLR